MYELQTATLNNTTDSLDGALTTERKGSARASMLLAFILRAKLTWEQSNTHP